MTRLFPEKNAEADDVMPFGKHKGRTLGWIAANDLLYLDWLNGLENLYPEFKVTVEVLCERYRSEITEAMDRDPR